MKFIIGLGNPGKEYSNTRHNVGFKVLDFLAKSKLVEWNTRSKNAAIAKTNDFLLIKPMQYMNLSGPAILPFIKKFNPNFNEILVVHDDMDIEFGKIKFKKIGSSAGHKGVQSIIDVLQSNEFPRLRVGVGRSPEGQEPIQYVLSNFTREELEKMYDIVALSAEAVCLYAESGIDKAMNFYNRR